MASTTTMRLALNATTTENSNITETIGNATAVTQTTTTHIEKEGLADWVIPVIVVAAIVVLLALLIGGVFFWNRRRKKRGTISNVEQQDDENKREVNSSIEAHLLPKDNNANNAEEEEDKDDSDSEEYLIPMAQVPQTTKASTSTNPLEGYEETERQEMEPPASQCVEDEENQEDYINVGEGVQSTYENVDMTRPNPTPSDEIYENVPTSSQAMDVDAEDYYNVPALGLGPNR